MKITIQQVRGGIDATTAYRGGFTFAAERAVLPKNQDLNKKSVSLNPGLIIISYHV